VWSLVFLAGGIAAFWGGWKLRQSALDFLRRSVKTQAEIIDVVMQANGAGPENRTHWPVVRFTDTHGNVIEKKSRMSVPRHELQEATHLTIRYDPDNPEDIRIGERADMSFAYALFMLGSVLIVLGAYGAIGE